MSSSISSALRRPRGVLAVAMLALLVGVALLRTFELVDSVEAPRTAVGEQRWFDLATQVHLLPVLAELEADALSVVSLPELSEIEVTWVLAMLRYACPASAVQIHPAHSAQGGSGQVRIDLTPACTPAYPEFLSRALGLRGPTPLERAAALVRLSVALCLFWAVGAWLVRDPTADPRVRADGAPSNGALANGGAAVQVAWVITVGWAVLALVGTALAFAGLDPAWALVLGAVALAAHGLTRFRQRKTEIGSWATHASLAVATTMQSWALLICCWLGLLAVVKSWTTPLWSWDHHFIWGFKARQLGAGARHFLETGGFGDHAVNYPIGMPVASVLASLGSIPTPTAFHLEWIAMILLISAIVYRMVREASSSVRYLALGLMLASPLLWDMEGLGLAELPVLLFSLASLVCAMEGGRRGFATTMVCLLMLVNLKPEGSVLALCLCPCLALLLHRSTDGFARRPGWSSVIALGSIATVVVVTRLATIPASTFFSGRLVDRLSERLQDPWPILELAGQQLLYGQWFVLWIVTGVPVVLGVTRVMRREKPESRALAGLLLFGAALASGLVYLAVYLATYNDPAQHILTSWHRIVAPLTVWGIVACVWFDRHS